MYYEELWVVYCIWMEYCWPDTSELRVDEDHRWNFVLMKDKKWQDIVWDLGSCAWSKTFILPLAFWATDPLVATPWRRSWNFSMPGMSQTCQQPAHLSTNWDIGTNCSTVSFGFNHCWGSLPAPLLGRHKTASSKCEGRLSPVGLSSNSSIHCRDIASGSKLGFCDVQRIVRSCGQKMLKDVSDHFVAKKHLPGSLFQVTETR